MITTRMETREILNEFWKDYKNTIRPRLLSWIRYNSKKFIKSPSKFKDKNGFVILNDPHSVKTDSGNSYKCRLKVKVTKDYIEYITTTYTIILDSLSGKNQVLIFPSSENYNYLIILEAHTLQRYNALVLKQPSLDFRALTDEFIRAGNDFYLQYDPEIMSDLGNSYIEFGRDTYGIATYTENTKTVEIRTFLLGSDLKVWREELNLSENSNPLEIYLKKKEKNRVFSRVLYPTTPQEDLKKRQISEAWEEYEKHR